MENIIDYDDEVNYVKDQKEIEGIRKFYSDFKSLSELKERFIDGNDENVKFDMDNIDY